MNWSEVGGNDAEINPYQRDPNSGNQELMETLVMKEMEMIEAPDMILLGMMGPINIISEDENGIGYSVYFYEQFMAPNEQLKLAGVDGVVPDHENIRKRAYPPVIVLSPGSVAQRYSARGLCLLSVLLFRFNRCLMPG